MPGHGVPRNPAEALRWYLRAAEQGYAIAQTNAAVLYIQGDGVPRDLVMADGWLLIAAANGVDDAAKASKELHKHMSSEQIRQAEDASRKQRVSFSRSDVAN